MDPFDIFPVKVWEEILHRLKKPLDKLNLILSHQSLELLELFQENQTEWNSSAGLIILLDHLYLKNTNPKKSWLPEDELKSAVLNCRLVSKGTKRIVDNLVELYWKKFCWIPPFASPIRLDNLEQVKSCLARAEQLRRSNQSISPFIKGGVFYLHCGEGVNNFRKALPSLDNIAQLLSHPNIGANLRGIRITLTLADLPGGCNFVTKLVQSLPNVIIMSINFFNSANNTEEEFQQEPVATLAELPNLKHLELHDYVRLESFASFLQNYFEFSVYFEQLTCLEMTLPFWKEHYNGHVEFLQLKTLQFNDVALTGQQKIILDIIESLNAPVLERFTLETMVFNLFQFKHENLSFATFLREEVRKAISGRPGQRWDLCGFYMKNVINPRIVIRQSIFKLSNQEESSTK